MSDKRVKQRFIDVFNHSIDIVFSVILVFILLGIAIGVLRLFLSLGDLLVLKKVSGSYLPIISDVLTLFILIELSRSLIDYFDVHRLRLTFIIDAGIVFVLRELMIKMFENKISVEEMLAISAVQSSPKKLRKSPNRSDFFFSRRFSSSPRSKCIPSQNVH